VASAGNGGRVTFYLVFSGGGSTGSIANLNWFKFKIGPVHATRTAAEKI
jgi:hypothetical protein